MSRRVYAFFCVAFALILASAQALPKCVASDERCRDRRMHPDLPDDGPPQRDLNGEDTNDYWIEQGKAFVQEKLKAALNTGRAKNIILFLGDGMGLTTQAAARILSGGEASFLSFEKFPYTGLSRTYAVNKIVADSANTATAYLCGVKAMVGTIGLNGNVSREDCDAYLDTDSHVYSIAKWAMDAGKSAGLVTTTRVTHASPAGVYAHIADRDWESDTDAKEVCGAATELEDIGLQLIHGDVGKRLSLIMGGGRSYLVDPKFYEGGLRSDERNLIEEYQQESARNAYVTTREDLMNLNFNEADRILGLFNDDHLLYHLEKEETTDEPTLEEMTLKAIEFLSRDEEGYFIFIEGGRIDLAHHDNMARLALDETLEFAKAIQAARDATSEEDTLIVVTADHSHAFSISGYAYRGNDIFGRTPATPDDNKPFMTLNYANGPSYPKFYDEVKKERLDPTQLITGDLYDEFAAAVPLDSETHGGDDVAVFASGPWSHLFTGVYEQNTIPHMMAYASCVGDGLTMCDTNRR